MNCEKCGGDENHLTRTNKAKENIKDLSLTHKLASFYKIMGDETRLNILTALETGPLCVSDLACALDMSLSAISHQLATLKEAKLVKNKKISKMVYYELDDDHIKQILDMGIEPVME